MAGARYLDSVVEGEPVEENVGEELSEAEDAVDHPVGEPLGVVFLTWTLDGFDPANTHLSSGTTCQTEAIDSRVVGRVHEADQVAEQRRPVAVHQVEPRQRHAPWREEPGEQVLPPLEARGTTTTMTTDPHVPTARIFFLMPVFSSTFPRTSVTTFFSLRNLSTRPLREDSRSTRPMAAALDLLLQPGLSTLHIIPWIRPRGGGYVRGGADMGVVTMVGRAMGAGSRVEQGDRGGAVKEEGVAVSLLPSLCPATSLSPSTPPQVAHRLLPLVMTSSGMCCR